MKSRLLLCALLIALTTSLSAQQPTAVPLPPMGWSSWNSFSNIVDSENVMAQAKAMASNGMQKAGYQYINIDEGWWLGERHPDGSFVIDPKAWPALAPGEKPGDMANIVRYIHSLGLKAGIYTDAGKDGCSMYPDLGPKYFHTGSEGHYDQDFLQFARWGFDYVKVDWCGGDKENLDPATQYAEIAKAIARAEAITGHHLYFSICEWGKNSPWTWAPNIGGSPADIWRTSGDIVAPIVAGHEHADRKVDFPKMLSNFDQGIHPEAQHTGFFNDPDMMVLGMPGLSDEQNRLHMSLWAISGAPLLVGADLTTLTPTSLATLTNPAVVAIDQDPLALQAVKIASPAEGIEVWSKFIAPSGHRAVLLLNRTKQEANISVQWSALGLDASRPVKVKDLWSGKELTATQDGYSAQAPAGDFAFLLVSGTETKPTHYTPAVSKVEKDAQVFANVTSNFEIAPVEITYTNPEPSTRFINLRVNEQTTTRVALPSTKTGKGHVWVQVLLDHGNKGNQLVFSNPCACGGKPGIETIAVQ
ncbi:MAG: alpha-galactosidase [Acidobacteriota bacterium]|nr:alpha-galactosidase [Acidobacteriota bacterium]